MDVPLETLELSLISRELKKKKLLQKPYMEVGCGDGFNLERFSALGMRGSGLDFSTEAIESARERNFSEVKLHVGDFLENRSYPSAEVIFMLNFLEHVREDSRFITKAANLLPQGGYLVIAVPANQKAFGFADENAGHIRRYNADELKQKLKTAGFAVDAWFSVGFPVNRSYTWLFNILNRHRSKGIDERQTPLSGIRNKKGYYGSGFDLLAVIAFPILKVAIQIDRLFIHTDLGNNFIVFAKKI